MGDDGEFIRTILSNPGDLLACKVYADWLEENGSPDRSEYLRLKSGLVDTPQTAKQRPAMEKRAASIAQSLNLEWLRTVELQNVLCRLCRRLGGVVPPALMALWRESMTEFDPHVKRNHYPQVSIDATWLREIILEVEREFDDSRQAYLDNNPARHDAFTAMFEQIDFLGLYGDGGDQFGLWRHDDKVTAVDAPIVLLDTDCRFMVGGSNIQDFIAIQWHDHFPRDDEESWNWGENEREDFRQVREWFLQRGIIASPSPEMVAESIKGLPNPQERFERFCRR